MPATMDAPAPKKEMIEEFDRNCRLANFCAYSMQVFTGAAIVVSFIFGVDMFTLSMAFITGALMLILYRLLCKFVPFLQERGLPIKLALPTVETAPMPKPILRVGQAIFLSTFCMVFLGSFVLLPGFMSAARAASSVIYYFGMGLTIYMYCALIALLVLSLMVELVGLDTLDGEKHVQRAAWRDSFFIIPYGALLILGIISVGL